MLKIKDLKVVREKKTILNNISLEVGNDQIHAVLGPNGSGKSTLANTIMANPQLEVADGKIVFMNKNITKLSTEERAKLGIFLAFQYPQEVIGVSLKQFLKLCYEEIYGKVSYVEFNDLVESVAEKLKFNKDLLERNLNVGFSGGEKKKCEILQIAILRPKLIILDETDSGLDISSLKVVAENVKEIKKNTKASIIVITHYSRILQYLKPDQVHVLNKGTLVKSGGIELMEKIESGGFESLGL